LNKVSFHRDFLGRGIRLIGISTGLRYCSLVLLAPIPGWLL
jgi:retinol dehydrogenase-12